MRNSKLLAKLRANKPARICSLGSFNPHYVAHAAHHGFDCIWLDQEHREMQLRELQGLLAFFHLHDIDCMLRPSTLEKSRLYRYLEDGATGLLIPHVSTEEKARMLVDAVKFPPIGDRGLDGSGLDADYLLKGPEGARSYPERANRETFLVVQIETPLAVANVDAIAAVAGIDGLFVGPGDLGLRIGQNPGLGYTLTDAVAKVAEAAARHGKAWGQPAMSEEHLAELTKQGARLVSFGSEFFGMTAMFRQANAAWEKALEQG